MLSITERRNPAFGRRDNERQRDEGHREDQKAPDVN